MASEKQKSMIRIDYQVLRETKARDGHVDVRLVKKARRLFGRAAREEILRIMDPVLRVQASEIAERHVTPQSLHEIGQQAILEAIKLYRVGQPEDSHAAGNGSRQEPDVCSRSARPKAGSASAAVLK